MKRLSVGVLGLVVASTGLVVASTGIVGCAGLVAGSALALLKLSTSSLPGGALQYAYSASVSVTGGRPPYQWGVISGQLPPGLALSTVSGGISGMPLQTGTFTFSVQVKDSTGHSDSSAYSVNIASVPAPNPAPIIGGASPNSGPTSGGTAVTISGTNFQTGATVLFGGLGAVPVTILSATQIQVMTPTHVAGPVDVTVQNPDGQSATLRSGFTYTATPPANPPTITGITPNSGPTSGGTAVTISGTNFQTGATVLFSGLGAAPVTIVSATQIQVMTTAHVAGPVDVTVQNPDGQSATLRGGFVYTAVSPTVNSVSPNTGSTAGGTAVSITGTNFLAGALVLFGTASAPIVTVNSATQIQAVTPAKAAGLVDVTVQNSNGQSGLMTGAFTYTAPPVGPPSITSISPNSGGPGTQVTINGANFASGATLSFGTINAPSVTFVSSTQLTASVPTEPPAVVDVKVTNPGGLSGILPGGFTVASAQSFLAGMTPANFTLPSGWTLVTTQDFEGSIPTNWDLAGTVSTANPHSGGKSLGGLYDTDGKVIHAQLNGLPAFRDLYVSYWDWEDSNGLYPTEEWVGSVSNSTQVASPGHYQDFGWDILGQINQPKSCASMVQVTDTLDHPDTGNPATQGQYAFTYVNGICINAGSWRQYEIWFHPNTVTAGVANNDGFVIVYMNGAVQSRRDNVNLNGIYGPGGFNPYIGSGNVNSFMEIGGVITAFCDLAETTRANPFSLCPANAPSPFHRYIDDIIVMKK